MIIHVYRYVDCTFCATLKLINYGITNKYRKPS